MLTKCDLVDKEVVEKYVVCAQSLSEGCACSLTVVCSFVCRLLSPDGDELVAALDASTDSRFKKLNKAFGSLVRRWWLILDPEAPPKLTLKCFSDR